MTEKSPIVRPITSNFVRTVSRSKEVNLDSGRANSKIIDYRNSLPVLENEISPSKKASPLLAYSGYGFPTSTPSKHRVKNLHDRFHSVSYGASEANDIVRAVNGRDTPGTEDDGSFHHSREVSREKYVGRLQTFSHSIKTSAEIQQPQQQTVLSSKIQLSYVDPKVLYGFKKRPAKVFTAVTRQTLLEDLKKENSLYKITNESMGYDSEDNHAPVHENFDINKYSMSLQRKQEKFYGALSTKSPKILISKKYRQWRKESEANHLERLALPASITESAKQAYAKLPSIGGKSAIIHDSQDEHNDAPLMINNVPGDKKLAEETPAVKLVKKIASAINKQDGAFKKVKAPKSVIESLIVAGMKKKLKNSDDRFKMYRKDKSPGKGFSRPNLDEIEKFDTEGSDLDLTQSSVNNNKKQGLIKFNSQARLNRPEDPEELDKHRFVTEEAEDFMETKSIQLKEVIRLRKAPTMVKPAPEHGAKVVSIGCLKVPKKVKVVAAASKQADQVDPAYMKKLEAYREFVTRLAFSFNIQIKSPEKLVTPYKYYIGKGNNHMLIRALMKSRWWWAQTDSKNPKEINFQWTQWRNKKYIESLQPKEKKGAEEAKSSESLGSVEREVRSEPESERNTEDLKGVVTDPYKRLFTKRERELIEEAPEAFKNGANSKQYEELGRRRADFNFDDASDSHNRRVCNHIEDNFHLANKKALLMSMKSYYGSIGDDVFKHLPLTFHIKNGLEDEEFKRFVECYKQREKEIQEQESEEKEKGKVTKKQRNIWIVKPGEDTNKGKGIQLANDLEEIKGLVGSKVQKASRTHLVQLYLDRPLLYNKRKFDIRCYMLISCINGVYKGYWYQEGYFRTSSKEFTLKNIANKQIHLTNDAIQVKYDDYGKWESGNKVSYSEFEKYLSNTYGGTVDFHKNLYPKMKELATDTIKAVYGIVDPHKRENTFEVFGLDFMIDSSFNVWLIEVNTNPDITIPTPKLGILIPTMVENALKLTIDVIFPPPSEPSMKKPIIPENFMENNRFELVFDETEHGHMLKKTLKSRREGLKNLAVECEEGEEDSEEDGGKD